MKPDVVSSFPSERSASDGGAAASAITERRGCAVLVDGGLVAWFIDPEEAVEWARDCYFGRWTTWRSKPPELIPLTPAEYAECMRRGGALADKIRME